MLCIYCIWLPMNEPIIDIYQMCKSVKSSQIVTQTLNYIQDCIINIMIIYSMFKNTIMKPWPSPQSWNGADSFTAWQLPLLFSDKLHEWAQKIKYLEIYFHWITDRIIRRLSRSNVHVGVTFSKSLDVAGFRITLRIWKTSCLTVYVLNFPKTSMFVCVSRHGSLRQPAFLGDIGRIGQQLMPLPVHAMHLPFPNSAFLLCLWVCPGSKELFL